MSYALAPSLKLVFADVNKKWPKRSKASDGWIGDPSHQARKSDHNPAYHLSGKRKGLVHAVDITVKGTNAKEIIRQAMQHPSTWYIIHKGIIRSRTYGWAARKYTGNPHTHHIHISILYTEKAEFSKVHWLDFIDKSKPAPKGTRTVSVKKVRRAFKDAQKGKSNSNVTHAKHIQQMLKNAGYSPGAIDGVIGKKTFQAFKKFEKKEKFKYADGIPSTRGLTILFRRGGEKTQTRLVG